jgi:hypothetical protein
MLYVSMKEGPQGKSSQSFLHSLRVIRNSYQDVLESFKTFLRLSPESNSDVLNFNIDLTDL